MLCFCSVMFLYYVLSFVAFRSFVAFISFVVLCSVPLPSIVLFLVSAFLVSFCLFNKMGYTYTLLYIIDKGGRKNFLREDVSAVLRDEALSAFENIVIGFHEYKSTTLTPYNREKHHFFIYF